MLCMPMRHPTNQASVELQFPTALIRTKTATEVQGKLSQDIPPIAPAHIPSFSFPLSLQVTL